MRSTYEILVGKLDGERQFEMFSFRREDMFEMHPNEMACESVGWLQWL
jgi:hypothetical protein